MLKRTRESRSCEDSFIYSSICVYVCEREMMSWYLTTLTPLMSVVMTCAHFKLIYNAEQQNNLSTSWHFHGWGIWRTYGTGLWAVSWATVIHLSLKLVTKILLVTAALADKSPKMMNNWTNKQRQHLTLAMTLIQIRSEINWRADTLINWDSRCNRVPVHELFGCPSIQ